MSAKLLRIEDSELENVTGGLIIEKDCNNFVSRVIASREEYRYIKSMGYFKENGLNAEDVEIIKYRFARVGFRVRSHIKLPSKHLTGANDKSYRAELFVID